jgi:small-conductance mechanosensitive channel
MSDEITGIINTLCEKLGVAANILVPEMTRYYIARLTFLTFAETILAIIMAIISVRITKWILSKTDNDWYDWSDKALMLFFANLIPGILLIILFFSVYSDAADLVGWIASPTASAIREITKLIK